MTTVEFGGETWTLPYRGRFGYQIRSTLEAIMCSNGIALYAAMRLRGRARRWEDVYRRSFIRFAEANPDKLIEGYVGPKGGWGYRYIPKGEQHVKAIGKS